MAMFELNEETINEVVVHDLKKSLLDELYMSQSHSRVQAYVWVLQAYMLFDEYNIFIKEVIKSYPDLMKSIDTADTIGDDDGE